MAKQNISFIERHAEKVVIGIAGAVLLGASALYLVSTPNKAELGGEQFKPKDFYIAIKTQADNVLRRAKNSSLPDGVIESFEGNVNAELSPYKTTNIPIEFAQTFIPPSPSLPDIVLDKTGKIELAEILPPTNLVVSTGRAQARMPDPEIILASSSNTNRGTTNKLDPLPRDCFWVTVFGVLDRKAQRELFAKAKYDAHLRQVIVANVELERQELQSDATWGKSEIIQPYRPVIEKVDKEVSVIEADDIYVVPQNTANIIDDYRERIASRNAQAEILRPLFQDYLEKDPYEWSINLPQKIEDFEIDLATDYDILFMEDDSSARISGDADAAARKQAKEDFEEAEKALEKDDFIKMAEKLDLVINNSSASQSMVNKANDMLKEYEHQIALAQRNLDLKAEQERAEEKLYLGEDAEPIWAIDTSVVPGKTYRYRIRLVVFNSYFNISRKLKNYQDAGKVLIEGQWSDWMEPVTVKRKKYLFFTRALDPKTAKLEVHEYLNGDWRNESTQLAVGSPISFTKRRINYSYDGMIVSLATKQPYRERTEKFGKISYRQKESDVLTLINSKGEVEERYALDDLAEKRDLDKEKKETIERIKKFTGEDNDGRRATPSERGPRETPPTRRRPRRGGQGGFEDFDMMY